MGLHLTGYGLDAFHIHTVGQQTQLAGRDAPAGMDVFPQLPGNDINPIGPPGRKGFQLQPQPIQRRIGKSRSPCSTRQLPQPAHFILKRDAQPPRSHKCRQCVGVITGRMDTRYPVAQGIRGNNPGSPCGKDSRKTFVGRPLLVLVQDIIHQAGAVFRPPKTVRTVPRVAGPGQHPQVCPCPVQGAE